MIVVYVAGPYTGDAWQTHANIHAAMKRGRDVARMGAMPLIPHANTPACFLSEQDPAFWYAGTMELLRRCDALITVEAYRAGTSEGTDREIAWCFGEGRPVFRTTGDLRSWLDQQTHAQAAKRPKGRA